MICVPAECLRASVIAVIISTISPGTSVFETVSAQADPALNKMGTTQFPKSKPVSSGEEGRCVTGRRDSSLYLQAHYWINRKKNRPF